MSANPADPTPISLKAFDMVSEWSRHITTIASATLVLSATFIKDIISGSATSIGMLTWAWITLLLSILAGVFVLGSLTASLNKHKLDVYAWGIKITAIFQVVLFLGGISLFIWFVYA